jgi:hypothetical protein
MNKPFTWGDYLVLKFIIPAVMLIVLVPLGMIHAFIQSGKRCPSCGRMVRQWSFKAFKVNAFTKRHFRCPYCDGAPQ